MVSCVYVLIYSIKFIHNIEYKMYFSNKRRIEQIYKTSLQNETVRYIRKRKIRREVLLKTLQNSQENPLLEFLFS